MDLFSWPKRPHRQTDYFLIQALSGHGCFKKYLLHEKSTYDKCVLRMTWNTLSSYARGGNLLVRLTYVETIGRIFEEVDMMKAFNLISYVYNLIMMCLGL